MTISEWIKNKVLGILGIFKREENPKSEKFTYFSDDEGIKLENIKANKVWFNGNGDDILNFYTQKQAIGFSKEPIYNRNKRNYFWSLSSQECDIKRVHSGVPNAIIMTLSNVVGIPKIDVGDKTEIWDRIAEENDFYQKLSQFARPLTMVAGHGAWKVNFDTALSDLPILEYVDGEYVRFVYKQGKLIGMIFESFYTLENKDYICFEMRYIQNKNSYISYDVYAFNEDTSLSPAPKEIWEKLGISDKVICIPNYNKLTAVPAKYLYSGTSTNSGMSIFEGKLDLFDMLDEILSQASQTNRVSTPVEYYAPDVLERGSNGFTGMPKLYNRQMVQKNGIPDGEGNLNQDIVTTQPSLNFGQYSQLALDVLGYILTGRLSPATLGIDIAKKDNAEAQREKEKITLFMRDNIGSAEIKMIKNLVSLSLDIYEFLQTDAITINANNDISVKFDEFANPSFENEIQILGSAWSQGQISTEKYVDLLWGDKLSTEDKQKEIEWLDNNRQKDDVDLTQLMGGNDENGIKPNVQSASEDKATLDDIEEQTTSNDI